jgi:hypothetical protein
VLQILKIFAYSRLYKTKNILFICTGVDYTKATMIGLHRAQPEKLRSVFDKYASSTDKYGQKFMTADDFVRKFVQFLKEFYASLAYLLHVWHDMRIDCTDISTCTLSQTITVKRCH